MKATYLGTSTLVGMFLATHSFAQIDVDMTRYQVRKPVPAKVRRMPAVSSEKSPAPLLTPPQPEPTPSPQPTPVPTKVKSLEQATVLPQLAPPDVESPLLGAETPSFTSRLQSFVLGGEPQQLSQYRSYLMKDDLRRNIVEILFAPVYIYNDSSSNYWFRNYNAAAPGGVLGATIWITPFFGLQSQYITSFGETVSNSPTSRTVAPATDNWFSVGFRFRKFFEGSNRPASFVWGIDYSTYDKKLPPDEQMRVGISTKGVKLLLESQLPVGNRYSWTFGLDIAPYQNHQENSTGLSLASGNKSETYGFGASIGGQIQMVRTNRLYWKAKYYGEKNIYTGPANKPDPTTSSIPSGVSVTNTFLLFEVGYIWGY